MGSLKVSALAAAFTILMPAAAGLAADMYEPPAPRVPVEIGTGWYLRGDIGWKMYNAPSAHFDVAGYGDMINSTLSNTGSIGGGFGYKFNDNFRADATIDYEWPGHFHGNLPCPGLCGAPPALGQFSDEYADISAWTGLVNGYIDLGTWNGLTPYVGAGVGVSYLTTSNVHYTNPDQSTGTWGGTSTVNLAWALMAGASYDFGNQWLLDVNYRYLNLGNAESSGTDPVNFGNQPIHYDNIHAQEVRVGLRYMLQ